MTSSGLDISTVLLAWYQRHARALPWRSMPGCALPNDPHWPYRVWLSEVMLQQTTVEAVIPYFESFLTRWPTVTALAAAQEEDVLAAWAGLGYYARARNLVKAARQVALSGAFPQTEQGLRTLPGIGEYTAAAIAAIAFGQRAVVMDANIERIAARLFGIGAALPAARAEIRVAVDAITPSARAGDFAQAMMDIGANICTARAPNCGLCPLAPHCVARQEGTPLNYPVKAPKKERPTRRGRAFWIESDGKVWLIQRSKLGLLAGMRALPCDGWSSQEDGSLVPPFVAHWRDCGTVKHIFTHLTLELQVLAVCWEGAEPLPPGQWWDIAKIADAGLPSLFVKATRRALAPETRAQ